MPFFVRNVEPVNICRNKVENQDNVLENVSNSAICQVLRQLASLVCLANDVFGEIYKEFHDVNKRSDLLKERITNLDTLVGNFNPKLVQVRKYNSEQKCILGVF
jgi:hypothetical protein